MLKKLIGHNITGNFFNIIKNSYTNDKACIKIGSEITEYFTPNLGVRQGGVLSPLLFNIFLSDLAKDLQRIDGKLNLGTHEIGSLFWADDIILLSTNEHHLSEMLRTVEDYCNKSKLSINAEKTKCKIFNKS